MAQESKEIIGLSSLQALEKLRQELEHELDHCTCPLHGSSGFKKWSYEAFSHRSVASTFRWPSILLALSCSILLIITFCETSDSSHLLQSILVVGVLALNLAVLSYDTKCCQQELHLKVKFLAGKIKSILEADSTADLEAWTSGKFFPQLYLPHSPCITLQWTFRDGRVVNLPTVLLVAGDVIKLCPGTPAPGHCRKLITSSSGDVTLELKEGEIFVPQPDQVSTDFTGARLRKSVEPAEFVLLESPYLNFLRNCFEKCCNRPKSLYDKERHQITATYIQCIMIPTSVMILFVIFFFQTDHFTNLTRRSFINFFNRLALVTFPLVPFSLPISWVLLKALGVSKLLNICRDDSDSKGRQMRNNEMFYDDIDTEVGSDLNDSHAKRSLSEVYQSVLDLLFCRKPILWRSAGLLQSLGSLTALCCVDKKGILSWPNPTADKVFFLTSSSSSKKFSTVSELMSPQSADEKSSTGSTGLEDGVKVRRRKGKLKNQSRSEVLDVTHDPHSASSMQFDDPNWDRFLPNLKPLGLAVLLNTCNPQAHEEYIRFCDHITCEALNNEVAVPVVNKRCLCELSRQIGFTDSAVKDYQYLYQIAMFRHVRHEIIQHGKLLNSLNIPRLKMPFPHVSSALIKEKITNTYQLFSQGTGDLVLDACSEYWDGTDLRILTDSDRKRILDFYHRSSLTAYCMAFSYVPVTVCPDASKLKGYYLELAPDSSHVFATVSTDIGNVRWSDAIDGRNSSQSRLSSHYLSNESLIVKDNTTTTSNVPSPSHDTVSAESLAAQMNNEVFIGMVTMQYQACPDFVQLVEQLEKACIRFVHFSKENELRSRVFSEKMGLESGWNCHISLHSPSCSSTNTKDSLLNPTLVASSNKSGSKISLNDPPRQNATVLRSQSAPCSVSLETCMVKFAEGQTAVIANESSDEASSTSSSSSSSSGDEEKPLNNKRKLSNNVSSPSPSRVTDSTGTETAGGPGATIAFDILNRAKLPKGIENIRPHLENVDNVPLLVSLFTDCTPETTREMISIMQEYGEVVCVLGSSANMYNIPIFLQADVSIGIEPLYPEVCVKQTVVEGDPYITSQLSNVFMSPTNLARHLISLPCSLSLRREDPFSLYRLVMEARSFMNNLRNSLQFLLCCSLSLSIVQLFASMLLLPPLLTSGQVVWLVFFILPVLSFSLMGTPVDPHIMTMATGKNLNLGRESVIYFLLCYLIKFSPSMLLVVASFAWILYNFSNDHGNGNSDNSNSGHVSSVHSSSDDGSLNWHFGDSARQPFTYISPGHLLISQTFVAFILVVYLVAISIGFVHRCHLFWQRSPLSNKCWVVTSTTIILCHLLFCLGELWLFVPVIDVYSITPLPLTILTVIWPLVLIPLNTLVKRKEIKANNRQQRRARLEFNTKLGMNSPF